MEYKRFNVGDLILSTFKDHTTMFYVFEADYSLMGHEYYTTKFYDEKDLTWYIRIFYDDELTEILQCNNWKHLPIRNIAK